MKRMILLASIAVIAMTSCTKNDTSDDLNQSDRQISFDASVGKNTKAPIIGTAFPTTERFGVWAFYKASTTYDYANPYIKDSDIGYKDGVWAPGIPNYWPLSGSLKFVAYSPFQSGVPTYTETDGLIFTDYIIYPGLKEGGDDFMYTEDNAAEALTTGAVPLTFKHALTQIYFAATTSVTGFTFTIKKIELDNVIHKGTFKTKLGWTLSSIALDKKVCVYYDVAAGVAVTSTAPHSFTQRVLIIPQPLTGVQIKVTYDITDSKGNTVAGQIKNLALTGDWLKNQRIKYTLDFAPANQITYTPGIIDWDAETVIPK